MNTTIQENSKRMYASQVAYPNCRVCRVVPLITDEDRDFGVCETCNAAPVKTTRRSRGLAPNCKGRGAVLEAYRANPNVSLRDLALICKLAATTVQYHLRKLNDLGAITYQSGTRHSHNTSGARAAKISKMQPRSTMSLEERINAIVERNQNKALADAPQHDVVRHINRPLNMRRGGRAG